MRMKPGCPFANNIVSETSTGATQTYLGSVFHENHVSEVFLFVETLQTLQKAGYTSPARDLVTKWKWKWFSVFRFDFEGSCECLKPQFWSVHNASTNKRTSETCFSWKTGSRYVWVAPVEVSKTILLAKGHPGFILILSVSGKNEAKSCYFLVKCTLNERVMSVCVHF
jgi:hypothetical protein